MNLMNLEHLVHLVDLVLLAKLIKPTEQFRQQVDDLFRVLGVLAEGGELDHVSEEQRAVRELVDVLLLVLDDADHVVGHEVRDDVFGTADLDFKNALIV